MAFVDAIDDVGSGSTQLSTSFTFEATDLIEIDIVSGDIQGPPLNGEFDYSQIIFTRVSVIRDGIRYDLDVNDGSKIKETGGADSGTKEQGDSFFTTNDDVTLDDPEFGSSISGTLAFSIDETFIDTDGNSVDPIIPRSRPDLDTNGDGDPDGGTVFNNENFNIGTVLSPPPIPCFVRGSLIETREGLRPVEDLKVGDYVLTHDNGLRQIRWIGKVTVHAIGKLAPIVIAKGALGNFRELRVSPEHRVLLSGWKAELLFGLDEALVAAKHLCNGDTIYRNYSADPVEYFHLMFDQHELLLSSGVWSESYYFDPHRTEFNSTPMEAELSRLFSKQIHSMQRMQVARPTLKGFEAKALF
ncbi:Hint domain-containing protein [Ruegeria arenilitoris]|uniref:Hint domain-containing protein n=1 Tax=Ruegeria arenilitoris TaxID=1173585 RepID=UPI001479C6E8